MVFLQLNLEFKKSFESKITEKTEINTMMNYSNWTGKVFNLLNGFMTDSDNLD